MDFNAAQPPIAIAIFDIDGVIRDVGGSYRKALADTVEHYTAGAYRPSQPDIDALKAEGIWNNDWEASQEMIYRFFEQNPNAQSLPRSIPIADVAFAAVHPSETGRGGIAVNYQKLVAFFQSRYRGTDPENWNGYICDEPLLVTTDYLNQLTHAGILWGFFSGATTGSARYVLERRLGLRSPVLVAMEDAPGKPDPTGLLQTVEQLEPVGARLPVLYAGDTVADMYTVVNARQPQPDRRWIAVGILPPHVQQDAEQQQTYMENLFAAGAAIVLPTVQALTPELIQQLIQREFGDAVKSEDAVSASGTHLNSPKPSTEATRNRYPMEM